MREQIYLTAADHGRELTWDEFRTSDAALGSRYELIEGKVYVTPFPSMSHSSYCHWLFHLLDAYAIERPDILARVLSNPAIFVPDPNVMTFTRADIASYAVFAKRLIRELDYRDYSPSLVVEVLSSDDPDKDLVRNRRLYLQTPRVKEYWILDPRGDEEELKLLAYRRRGRRWASCHTLAAGETYTTPMLPGFSLLLDPHAADRY